MQNPPLMTLLLALLLLVATSLPDNQKITIPGYSPDYTQNAYAGYLNTESDQRKLHYIFLQSSREDSDTAPVVLWMNGGPGCTSKIGFLQEVGPFYLPEGPNYDLTQLVANPYSWVKLAHLLFIDSPAGVGYSINSDVNYTHNDMNTARDNLAALNSFFIKFDLYKNNKFFIGGESYAGKYIPDLALRILESGLINLQGILIGNGILNWIDLQQNRVQFLISHNFIDPKLISYWEKSCKVDKESAGCQYFYERYQDLVYRIDQYNIYGQCYGRSTLTQKGLLAQNSKAHGIFKAFTHSHKAFTHTDFNAFTHTDINVSTNPNILPPIQPNTHNNLNDWNWCSYDKGFQDYFNVVNPTAFNKDAKAANISVCNLNIFEKYKVSIDGSMKEMAQLLAKGKIKVYLFNGDWDDVVPFTDTYKNLNRMGLMQEGPTLPWIIGDQHAGFIKKYKLGLKFYLVKGAGHEAPMYQRERTYVMFQQFLTAEM